MHIAPAAYALASSKNKKCKKHKCCSKKTFYQKKKAPAAYALASKQKKKMIAKTNFTPN